MQVKWEKPKTFVSKISSAYYEISNFKEEIIVRWRNGKEENISKMLNIEGKILIAEKTEEKIVLFVLKEGKSIAYRLDILLPKEGGMAIDVSSYSLGFSLSKSYYAVAKAKTLLVVDVIKQRYVFLSPLQSFSSPIEISSPTFLFIIDEKRAAIVDASRIYVVINGKRALILPKRFSFLSPVFALKKDKDYEWLLIAEEKEDFCIAISIGAKEQFGYTYFALPQKSFEKMKME